MKGMPALSAAFVGRRFVESEGSPRAREALSWRGCGCGAARACGRVTRVGREADPGLLGPCPAFWLAALKCSGIKPCCSHASSCLLVQPVSFSEASASPQRLQAGNGGARRATAGLAQHSPLGSAAKAPVKDEAAAAAGQHFLSSWPQEASQGERLEPDKPWWPLWETTAGAKKQRERRGFQEPHLRG